MYWDLNTNLDTGREEMTLVKDLLAFEYISKLCLFKHDLDFTISLKLKVFTRIQVLST